MRYVVAMICSLLGAGLAARFLGVSVAPWVARQFSYDSPDASALVETTAFLGILATGLIVGWLLGWLAAYPLGRRPRAS